VKFESLYQKLSGNIYWALVLRFLLAMFLFTLCRVGFYLFNISFFPGMTLPYFIHLLWGGLRFDLTALLYTNALFILLMIVPFDFRFSHVYQQVVKYLFFITNGVALAANVSDFIYYKFTLRRTTADVFRQFENEQNMGKLMFQFLIDYWYAFIAWLVLMLIMIKLYNRVRIWGPQIKNRILYYIAGTLFIPIVVIFAVAGIRGGFRHSTRPITLSNAGEYVKDTRDISIVLNTPFAIMRTLNNTKIKSVYFFSPEKVDSIYSPIHQPKPTEEFRKLNVVVIILESFSKEFFGTFNREKENGTYTGYTPFLDSLIQFSKTFEYSFANGRKSIDGLPSVISSIPSLGVPYFVSPYSGNRINSLASLLKPKGYHTSFFHGAPNGSMGFQAFMNLAGVEHYYGMTEYNNNDDFDGLWGIWDDKFLQFYADKMNEFPEPFMSSVFTVSSHHPFKVPEEYEGKFDEGTLPIHKCIGYTDFALRRFFQKVSKMPWYQNTLFVITADHTSSNIQYPEYQTAWGYYSIPIIFFRPDHELRGREQSIAQQIDIMPTVLGYLNYEKSFFAFGRDLLKDDSEPFAFNYKDNTYQLFVGDYILVFDGEKSVALYNFKTDKLTQHNLVNEASEIVSVMEVKIKAIIQQYNNRMVEDKLTVQ
jgi:phosphoglycerol transferase MdoB-like AlkP superfamily enzyme